MDKQLNARVNPELHNQIKQLSNNSKIIMNTLVETLLEIGLKHYRDSNIPTDSNSYVTKDDLITFESGLLKKVESLINLASGQAVVNEIATPETRHNQLDLTDIPPASQAIAVSPEVKKSLTSVSDKPKTKQSAKSKPILTRPEAMAIAQSHGFIGTTQNLYDWSEAVLKPTSDERRLANSKKLDVVGLVAAFNHRNKPAWQAKA